MRTTDPPPGVSTLVLATHNRDKALELRQRLEDLPLDLRGLWEWPDHQPIVETGATLEENARLKAEEAAAHTGLWAAADDTGLLVDALGGAPGVMSARFAGPDATYASNRKLLLERLQGVPAGQRRARFETVVAFARPGLETLTVKGWVEGDILMEERGVGGFGYDAVFYHPASGRTFAELTLEEKNAVSHRGRAADALRELIRAVLQGTPSSSHGSGKKINLTL